MYGFTQQAEAKDFGKKGLNSGAKLVEIAYNPNGGAGGSAADVLDISVQVGEYTYKTRVFDIDPTKVYHKNQIIPSTHPEYEKEWGKIQRNFTGYMSDLMACFLPATQIAEFFANNPVSNFKQYAQTVEKIIKSNPVWKDIPLDVFLQYQHTMAPGKNMTFLELPRNNKHGKVFAPGIEGVVWKEVVDEKGLKYLGETSDPNVMLSSPVHSFKRGSYFLDMNFWNQQRLDAEETAGTASEAPFGGGTPLSSEEQAATAQAGNWNFNV